MTKIYACLAGIWVCLNDDPNCRFTDSGKSPYLWWEEGAPIWAPFAVEDEPNEDPDLEDAPSKEHSFYYQNYVNIVYMGKRYRINPIFIQIVDE